MLRRLFRPRLTITVICGYTGEIISRRVKKS